MKDLNNIDDLRQFLIDELKKVSSGESTPAAANAMANIGGKVMQSVKMTLEYCRMTGQTPYIPFIKSLGKKEIADNKNQIEEK